MTDDIAPSLWRKSSYSGGNNHCVEVALRWGPDVAVRDSKAVAEGRLVFGVVAWREFVLWVGHARLRGLWEL